MLKAGERGARSEEKETGGGSERGVIGSNGAPLAGKESSDFATM
jgi:hypothetical protein